MCAIFNLKSNNTSFYKAYSFWLGTGVQINTDGSTTGRESIKRKTPCFTRYTTFLALKMEPTRTFLGMFTYRLMNLSNMYASIIWATTVFLCLFHIGHSQGTSPEQRHLYWGKFNNQLRNQHWCTKAWLQGPMWTYSCSCVTPEKRVSSAQPAASRQFKKRGCRRSAKPLFEKNEIISPLPFNCLRKHVQ